MDFNKNYYSVLGVDKNADEPTIKKAFKRLAKEYHPDVNPGKENEKKFKEINEAHQILTEERDKYDQSSPHGRNYNPNPFGGFNTFGGFNPFGGRTGNPFNMEDFNIDDDILNQVFNNINGARQAQRMEALDINLMVNITLADVYNNKPLNIKYTRKIKCPTCKGTGFDLKSSTSKCGSCNGSGIDMFRQPCANCAGTGKIYSKKCDCCKGERLIPKEENIPFEQVFRVKSDMNQIHQGMGNYSKYYNKVGNVSIIIKYQHDNRYEFTTLGLLYKMDIHFQDAIDGNPVEYNHLDGTKLKISLPKKTKDGDLIKLTEKGMYINKHQRGDLIIRINVIIDYDKLEKNKTTK